MSTTKFAVRLDNEVIWTCNGKEELYDSEEDALLALQEEMDACQRACELGYMDDEGDFDNYKIVGVTE